MKKLMTFCFIILFSVLSALSCFNFAFDALDRIERDKITIVIEKPSNISATDFLGEIDRVTEELHTDIMLRRVENRNGKAHYQYFKTSHTADFLKISTSKGNAQLGNGECISTITPAGYNVHRLNASALMQDISFYPLGDAKQYDLSAATYYVRMGQQSSIIDAITQLGYVVTVNPTSYISGQFSVLLFGFVPAFMLVASMAFYILSNGKKNVLKKMEGYTTHDVLADEVNSIFPIFAICFLIIEVVSLIVAAALYQTALLQYILFSLPNIAVLLMVVLCGFGLSALLVCRQNSAEHIKGRVPRRGIYFTTILAKGVFVGFIIFFLSIAIRNVTISYHTMQTSQFFADKVSGYVTVPVNTSNASIDHNPTIYLTTKGGGVPQEDRQALTDEQVERLLDAIRDLPPYVFVMIGLYAGLRREEILALQWDSVYLDTDTPYLTVRRAWHTEHNRPVISDELKTKAAGRNIPLPVCLAECLKAAKETSTSEYVVSNRDGEPLSYTQFKRLWQYIVTRTVKERSYYRYEDGKRVKHTVTPVLGEKAAHNGKVVYSLDFEVTPHQLRHTYITNLIHASVDPKTVQYLAGHESSKITMDIYAKVKYNRPDELVRSMSCAFASWDAAQ